MIELQGGIEFQRTLRKRPSARHLRPHFAWMFEPFQKTRWLAYCESAIRRSII